MGPNFFGYIAIFTLTVSLISTIMFSSRIAACFFYFSFFFAAAAESNSFAASCCCALPVCLHPHRHQPIPNPLPADMGPNFFGYIAILTLTVSLISSTILLLVFSS
jgi:hypothetical protein